jgi:hypothetical protein
MLSDSVILTIDRPQFNFLVISLLTLHKISTETIKQGFGPLTMFVYWHNHIFLRFPLNSIQQHVMLQIKNFFSVSLKPVVQITP